MIHIYKTFSGLLKFCVNKILSMCNEMEYMQQILEIVKGQKLKQKKIVHDKTLLFQVLKNIKVSNNHNKFS